MLSALKQSTAGQQRSIPVFIDDTDFKTLETGLTINNTDVKLIKNGAASVDKNSGGGTHRANGVYAFTFDATDTDTVGELTVVISVAGALVAVKEFWVYEEPVYDAIFLAAASGFMTTSDIRTAVYDATAASYVTAGTFGKKINDMPTTAQVNAEVVDAINVDTYPEIGQLTPPTTASLVTMMRMLHKLMINQEKQTATLATLFNAAGSTVDQKRTISDDGTTLTKGAWVSGP